MITHVRKMCETNSGWRLDEDNSKTILWVKVDDGEEEEEEEEEDNEEWTQGDQDDYFEPGNVAVPKIRD